MHTRAADQRGGPRAGGTRGFVLDGDCAAALGRRTRAMCACARATAGGAIRAAAGWPVRQWHSSHRRRPPEPSPYRSRAVPSSRRPSGPTTPVASPPPTPWASSPRPAHGHASRVPQISHDRGAHRQGDQNGGASHPSPLFPLPSPLCPLPFPLSTLPAPRAGDSATGHDGACATASCTRPPHACSRASGGSAAHTMLAEARRASLACAALTG